MADDQGKIYHIRVKGILDDKWADWFEGFVMTNQEGETWLSGSVVDQAALFGTLSKINSLGLSLLMVIQANCPCSKNKCERYGRCQECAAFHGLNGKMPFCFRPGNKWDKRCRSIIFA